MLHSAKSKFFGNILLFYYSQNVSAGRTGFDPRAVVWRSLFYTTGLHTTARDAILSIMKKEYIYETFVDMVQ